MTDEPLDDVDAGNVNGDVIDDPSPNAAVVGVDITSGAGNEPAPAASSPAPFDPADHTVAEVLEYLAAHPDDAERVVELERADRNRTGITGD